MKAVDLTNDELVKMYVQLRDRRSARKKEFEAADSDDKSKQDKIGAVLLQRYNAQGIESARTQFGTAFKEKVSFSSIADKEAVRSFVTESGLWDLVTIGPNKAGIKQYIDEHGDVPRGFNWREEVEIRVRRA